MIINKVYVLSFKNGFGFYLNRSGNNYVGQILGDKLAKSHGRFSYSMAHYLKKKI